MSWWYTTLALPRASLTTYETCMRFGHPSLTDRQYNTSDGESRMPWFTEFQAFHRRISRGLLDIILPSVCTSIQIYVQF